MKAILAILFFLIYQNCLAETINIKCSCQTKENPSECSVKTQEFQTLEWNTSAFSNEGINFDEKFLSEYCMRNKHIGCMCDDIKYFSGEIQKK